MKNESLNKETLTNGVAITERDAGLLCDLLAYGAMLPGHIQTLFFPDCGRRRMNQRLRQLCDAGLVLRRPLPLGLGGALPYANAPCAIPLVYRLGGSGAPLVAVRLGWDVADVRRLVRAGTPTAIAHTLEIVTLRIRAERAVQEQNEHLDKNGAGAVVRLEFLPERLIRHGYQVRAPGGEWREEAFKPDALLRLRFAGGQWTFCFTDVDLGHTSAVEWRKKAEIAVRYRHSGLFRKRYGGNGFVTLVCTTGERRLANLRRLLDQRLEPEDAACFGLATLADVAARGPLKAVWHVPGRTEPLSLEAWAPVQAEPEGDVATSGVRIKESEGGEPCFA